MFDGNSNLQRRFASLFNPKKYFFHFFSPKRAKVHPKMCLSESLSFFNGDGILIPLYRGREKKEEIVMLANQRRCDT